MKAKIEPTPQELLTNLCAKLRGERDALNMQLRALEAVALMSTGAVSADLLLALYLILPSATRAATFANEWGMRVPGASGKPRAVLPPDVYALIRGEPCVIAPSTDTALIDATQKKLRRHGGWHGS